MVEYSINSAQVPPLTKNDTHFDSHPDLKKTLLSCVAISLGQCFNEGDRGEDLEFVFADRR